MKNNGFNTNPYATNSGGRIIAPNPQKDQPKATVISNKNDMRNK